MRIDAVTTCVGEEYAGYLARTLPVWIETLDSLTIVTDNAATCTWLAAVQPDSIDRRVRFVVSDAFHRNGAAFNKGRALDVGIDVASPTDWVLAFDCDTLASPHWRQAAERNTYRGCLHGASRFTAKGRPEDRVFYPRGYFQLWHVADEHYRRSPIFEDHHQHAGRYDTEFAGQWPQEAWQNLGFRLTHLGQKAKQWYGPGTTPGQMRQAVAAAKSGKNSETVV